MQYDRNTNQDPEPMPDTADQPDRWDTEEASADAAGMGQPRPAQTSQPDDPRDGGWSDLGDRDLNTGVPASAQVGADSSFPDGNNVAGMRPGLADAELPPDESGLAGSSSGVGDTSRSGLVGAGSGYADTSATGIEGSGSGYADTSATGVEGSGLNVGGAEPRLAGDDDRATTDDLQNSPTDPMLP